MSIKLGLFLRTSVETINSNFLGTVKWPEFCGKHIQGVPGGKVNILGGHSIGHYKKKVYMNMCLIPNGFRYLARNIFLFSHSMSNHNSQLTLHTDSEASDISAVRWERRKLLRAKYLKPFGIGHKGFLIRFSNTSSSGQRSVTCFCVTCDGYQNNINNFTSPKCSWT
jgi:hypothetical protein